MIIYIDNDYKCHTSNDGTMQEFETVCFDGKCTKFIEGYRYIPPGETWKRSDGAVFTGEMISPWKDYNQLAAYQEAYEEAKAESAAEIEELEDQLSSAYTEESLKTAYEEGVNSV